MRSYLSLLPLFIFISNNLFSQFTLRIEIINLKQGQYAVRFYHDENLNRTMETNLVGKPTEGYGFSNNVTAGFGMPPFRKWLFDLNENKTIILKPNY